MPRTKLDGGLVDKEPTEASTERDLRVAQGCLYKKWDATVYASLGRDSIATVDLDNIDDDTYEAGTDTFPVGSISARDWCARSFTVQSSSNITCTGLRLRFAAVGTGATVNVDIYSDSSGKPGSQITNGDFATVAVTDTTAKDYLAVPGTAPTLVAGTQYWIVIERTTAADASNYINWLGTKSYSIRFNGALSGDSSSPASYGTVPIDTDLALPGDFTIEMWVYRFSSGSGSSARRIIARWEDSSSSNRSYDIAYANNGDVSAFVSLSTTDCSPSSFGSIPADEWVHVALVFVASTKVATIWVNGSSVNADTGSGTRNKLGGTSTVFFGIESDLIDPPARILIDMVRISDTNRTPLANRTYGSDSDTVEFWKFNEGLGNPRGLTNGRVMTLKKESGGTLPTWHDGSEDPTGAVGPSEDSGEQFSSSSNGTAWEPEGFTPRFGIMYLASGTQTAYGLVTADFNTEADKLVVQIADRYMIGDVANPTVFGTCKDGLTGTDPIVSVNSQDRCYVVNGTDENLVIDKDGSCRNMGMDPPTKAPTLTIETTASTSYRPPTAGDTGDWDNGDSARDVVGDAENYLDTYAFSTLSSPGSNVHTWDFNGAIDGNGASATPGSGTYRLIVEWGLSTPANLPPLKDTGIVGEGRVFLPLDPEGRVFASLHIEYTTDGSEWTTLIDTDASSVRSSSSVELTSVDPDNVHVRYTHSYSSGDGDSTAKIFDMRIVDNGCLEAATTGTVQYWFTEFDDNTGFPSAASPVVEAKETTAAYGVKLSAFGSAENTRSTHRIFYRTADGGVFPNGTEFARAGIATTEVWDCAPWSDLPPGSSYPYVLLGTLAFHRDTPFPPMRAIIEYEGKIVGASDTEDGYVMWSSPSNIEASPAIYRDWVGESIQGFSIIGDALIVYTTRRMIRYSTLPVSEDSIFDVGRVRYTIRGNLGVSSRRGIASVNIPGLGPLSFAVTPVGLSWTNGLVVDFWSKNIDWIGKFALDQLSKSILLDNPDEQRMELYLPANGSSVVDRVWYIHYDGLRESDGQPRWMGPLKLGTGSDAATASTGAGVTIAILSGQIRSFLLSGTNPKVHLEQEGSINATNMDARTGRIYPFNYGNRGVLSRAYTQVVGSISLEVATDVGTKTYAAIGAPPETVIDRIGYYELKWTASDTTAYIVDYELELQLKSRDRQV